MTNKDMITDILGLQDNMLSYLYGYMVGKIGLSELTRDKILDYIYEKTKTLKTLLLSLSGDDE